MSSISSSNSHGQCSFLKTVSRSVIGVVRMRKYRQDMLEKASRLKAQKKELEKRLERALEDAARTIDERDGKLYAILEDTKPMAFSVI